MVTLDRKGGIGLLGRSVFIDGSLFRHYLRSPYRHGRHEAADHHVVHVIIILEETGVASNN